MTLKGKRAFVFEDNLGNKAIAQMLLEQAGARVASDRWGVDALQSLKTFGEVDIVLVDLMYPRGVTGYDIFQEIKSDPCYAGTPVIAVSAADASIAIPKTQGMGFAGYIAKPIEFHNFVNQIEQVIRGENIWITAEKV
jgi:CheY-like chemotaxis protein